MGERVNAAPMVVEERVNAAGATEDVVYCPNCGEGDQGYAPVEYAEANWIDTGKSLACGVYCAAKVSGFSEKDAQLARAMKTRMDMHKAGMVAEAEADEELVASIAEGNGGPFDAPLEHVADEDTHEHDQTFAAQSEEASSDFEQIVAELRGTDESEGEE